MVTAPTALGRRKVDEGVPESEGTNLAGPDDKTRVDRLHYLWGLSPYFEAELLLQSHERA